nr:DUF3054 domain-containing protein [Auraticoccus cholistanensis]
MPVVVADLAAVVLFVLAGVRTHDGGIAAADVAATAWPFLLALLVGWALVRLWRAPRLLPSGLVVWLVTAAGGLWLRVLLTEDTARLPFVLVTLLTLAVLLLGWRAVVVLVGRSRARGR